VGRGSARGRDGGVEPAGCRQIAYDGDVIEGLHAALDALEGAAGLRAVVLRGN
jgi:hypothetical protein